MRISLSLLTLLLSSGSAFAALPIDIHAGAIVQVPLSELHPTQATLGYRQLDYKLHRYQAEPKKLFDDYCESMGQKGVKDFSAQSKITQPSSFSCKAPVGSEPGPMKTAVIAPDNQLYLTDGHHTFSNFVDVAGLTVPVQVRITDDFRSLKTMSEFWQKMEAANLVWLDTPNGKIKPDALPKELGRQYMHNEEYRSLVYFVRDIGFDKEQNPPPFLEFYWGKWLETQLPVSNFNLGDRYGYAKAVAAIAEKMTSVPKDTVIANSDSGTLTAQQLGARDKVNKKKLAKLSENDGKLTWAFAH
ncbi:ParB/Srx family N-terminal domain-containing protein [Pantoea sp.]|uniref:ParB/Srx family N-terminal domain-containing protein n=1 Tax=Pantoea sp. TaxID=69393 RepID=UPI0031DB98A9